MVAGVDHTGVRFQSGITQGLQHLAALLFGFRDDLALCDEPYAALDGADALVVVTEWKIFRSPDFKRVRRALREPVLFDGRNIYEPRSVEAAGLAYYGIGRGRSVRVPAA